MSLVPEVRISGESKFTGAVRRSLMNQAKGKLRIGVLGAGRVSRDLHLPVLINIPEVKHCLAV